MTDEAPHVETVDKVEYDAFKTQAMETNASLRKEVETLTAQLKGARDANAVLATQIPSEPAPVDVVTYLQHAQNGLDKILKTAFEEHVRKTKVSS